MKAQLDGTIWDLPTQANMALIWMTRKGSWVQVPHGPPVLTWDIDLGRCVRWDSHVLAILLRIVVERANKSDDGIYVSPGGATGRRFGFWTTAIEPQTRAFRVNHLRVISLVDRSLLPVHQTSDIPAGVTPLDFGEWC